MISPLFPLSTPQYQTSARKQPQKPKSALNMLDLKGMLSMKYLTHI